MSKSYDILKGNSSSFLYPFDQLMFCMAAKNLGENDQGQQAACYRELLTAAASQKKKAQSL